MTNTHKEVEQRDTYRQARAEGWLLSTKPTTRGSTGGMIVKYSTCCGVADTSVSMDGPDFSDIGICPKCKEHCEFDREGDDYDW